MSTLKNNQVWSSIPEANLSSKYEKCLNITEEIYKRINITFQIKKLEAGAQSDLSEQSDVIDSNELSNETDLFACDKSTSLPSSDLENKDQAPVTEKYININNNEEPKKKPVVCKRPRKKFRKRVKKRPSKPHSDSDGSSDEALPLSRVVELDTAAASPDHAGVPNILILSKDLKPKILSEKKITKSDPSKGRQKKTDTSKTELAHTSPDLPEEKTNSCAKCSMSFRGERGLKRHLAISHSICAEDTPIRAEREVKPA